MSRTAEGRPHILRPLTPPQGNPLLQGQRGGIRLTVWRVLCWLAPEKSMKKTAKPSSGIKSPREDVGHSRPKRRSRNSFLLEADIGLPTVFRASFEGHLPYRRIIE
jgi:hypothetical protein